MQDIFFITKCDHRINNYELQIKESGSDLIAKFPCVPVRVKSNIFIRSWQDQQKYIAELASYKDAQSYILYQGDGAARIDAPINGANAKIGITNYEFISEDTIKFLDTSKINIDKNIVPRNKYLVDFTADPLTCPKCNGTLVIRDINIDQTGKAAYVEGKDKIKQRVVKALLTPLGSSRFDELFGSELNTLIGGTITDETRITIQTTITNAINNLIADQPTSYTDEETINAIEGMTIEQDPSDATKLYVKVSVSNEVGEIIDCAIGFNLEDN